MVGVSQRPASMQGNNDKQRASRSWAQVARARCICGSGAPVFEPQSVLPPLQTTETSVTEADDAPQLGEDRGGPKPVREVAAESTEVSDCDTASGSEDRRLWRERSTTSDEDMQDEAAHPRLSSAELVALALGSHRSIPSPESAAPARPNFSGSWVLEQATGDFDTFLADMRVGWLRRTAARGFKYGAGRVAMEIEHVGEHMRIVKTLADPVNGRATSDFTIGEGPSVFKDDLGSVTCETHWEASGTLRFDVVVADTGLSLTLLKYYVGEGRHVEECISCKGTRVKYEFKKVA